MKDRFQVIKSPLITERSAKLKEAHNQVVFRVDPQATKVEIKDAVENLLNAKVERVNTSSYMGKVKRMGRFAGRRSNWKKAIVTLKEGQKLDFLEG